MLHVNRFHGILWKQNPPVKRTPRHESGKSSGKENPMPDSIELDKKDDTYSDAITYKELSDILQKSEVPVLVIFYSSKSERCDDVCTTFKNLEEHVGKDRVKFVKFDIEKGSPILEMCQVPTIKLYPGLKTEKKYPVEYFDDPLDVSNYERFLKEEGVIG